MVDLIISMVLSMGRVPGAIWLTFCMHTGKICEKFWPGMIVSFVQCSTILRILMSVFTMRKCIYLEALVGIANLLCAALNMEMMCLYLRWPCIGSLIIVKSLHHNYSWLSERSE